ncbi:MAG: SIMPL domain-containing protein [Gaiellales bacterium]
MKRIAIVSGMLLALAAFAGVMRPEGAKAVDDTTARDTVTVSGTGAVSAVPDRATISAGVETRAATAQKALSDNSADMQKVINALKTAGGTKITTSTVSLSPSTTPDGTPNGFVATNTVTAEFTLGAAGKGLDAAVAAGANTVWGPTFTNSDLDALYKKALQSAVADAKAHAEVLATAAGRKVGPVISISEASASPGPLYAAKDSAGAATPIVSGAQDTTATVSVTYELK